MCFAAAFIWMSGRLARELPHLGPTAPAEQGRKCALRLPRWELQKTKPRLEGGGVLSSDAMIALNWFMQLRIGNDGVAPMPEGHHRPR